MTLAAMTFPCLTIALFDSGLSSFFFQVVKVLVVAGGVLVGWLIGPVLVRLLVRLAFHRDTPPSVQTLSRFGCALLIGFLAYLIPIGGSGTGNGPGGGNVLGSTAGKDGSPVVKKDEHPQRDNTKKDVSKMPDLPETLSIRVLGGNDVKEGDDHYYEMKIDGKPTRLTENGVAKILTTWLQQQPTVKRIEILIDENKSVLATNPVVTDLRKRCEKLCQQHAPNTRVRTIIENK